MKRLIRIFPTPLDLARILAKELIDLVIQSSEQKKLLTIALSGGSTPELLFASLAECSSESIGWDYVHLFWVDERCVSPEDEESNFGMTRTKLLSKINIPVKNIHRIMGEMDPIQEASRYSQEVKGIVPMFNGFPRFDIVLLGMGEDGHTASIFPGNTKLFDSKQIYTLAIHPETFQKRITMTGKVINNSDKLIFVVTGTSKADILKRIIKNTQSALVFPASLVNPEHGELNWFLDMDSGILL